jgi:hypothetical protein
MTMIERVARKAAMHMFETWGDAEGVVWSGLPEQEKRAARNAAREFIEAMREPTEAMLGAHEALCVFSSQDEREDYRDNLREAWGTMISSALSETSGGGG